MGRIFDEAFWLVGPAFVDVFEHGEAFEGLEPFSEVVGVDESLNVLAQLVVR